MTVNRRRDGKQAKRFHINGSRGFALIELLVVISIISLLSSIVLASLTEARESARNAATISTIRQYITALNVYYNDNGGYPKLTANSACLGEKPQSSKPVGKECFNYTSSTELKGMLQEYIEGWPQPSSRVNTSQYSPGAIYYIFNKSDNCNEDVCTGGVSLYWIMENDEDDCVIPRAFNGPDYCMVEI